MLEDSMGSSAPTEELENRPAKNPPFTQFMDDKLLDMAKHIAENQYAMSIFVFLTKHMGKDNIVICPTSVLKEELGFSRSTVSRAIAYLKENDLVEVVRFGTTNAYGINGKYVWRTFNHPGRYAVFTNVKALAAKSDNKPLTKKLKHVYGAQGTLFDDETGEVLE